MKPKERNRIQPFLVCGVREICDIIRGCSDGGTGIRVRLKIEWGNPCGFDSRSEHQDIKRSHLWLVFMSLVRLGKNFPAPSANFLSFVLNDIISI